MFHFLQFCSRRIEINAAALGQREGEDLVHGLDRRASPKTNFRVWEMPPRAVSWSSLETSGVIFKKKNDTAFFNFHFRDDSAVSEFGFFVCPKDPTHEITSRCEFSKCHRFLLYLIPFKCKINKMSKSRVRRFSFYDTI